MFFKKVHRHFAVQVHSRVITVMYKVLQTQVHHTPC